jgi:plasmid maintenance system killer protein
VIQSFADQATADLFAERSTRAARRIPKVLWPAVKRKLKWIDAAHGLLDLASPPGNRPATAWRPSRETRKAGTAFE